MRVSGSNGNDKLSYIDNQVQNLNESKYKKCLLSRMMSYEEKLKILSKYIHNDFDLIFKIAYVLGITFTCESRQMDVPRRRNNVIKKYYDILINLLYFLSLALMLTFEHNFSISRANTLTSFTKYIACFIIRCNLIAKRSKIPRVMTTLSELYGEVSSSIYMSLKTEIFLQCLVLTSGDIVLLGITTVRIIYDTDIQHLPFLTFFGRNLTVTEDMSLPYILLAAHTLNHFVTLFTVSVFLLTCWNIHIILYRLIKSYEQSLIETIRSKATKETLTENLVTFRRIMNGISGTDDALSFTTFFLYVACISAFYRALSTFLTVENVFKNPYVAAETTCMCVASVIVFTGFTCSAALVSTAGENLKTRVINVSEIILQQDLPTETMLSFIILIENIKCSSTGMTGWGMFTITKGFVLSTVGVMITYGVLLFQFG